MYKIIGADQLEYGPVSAGELCRWIAEGRANAASLAWGEGATQWLPLAVFPEFVPALGSDSAAPQTIGPSLAPPPRTNPLAVTGLVMGLLSLTLGWFWVLLGWIYFTVLVCLLGLVFSCLGIGQVTRNPARETGKRLAVAGIVLCSLGFLMCLAFDLLIGLVTAMGDGLERLQ